MCVLCMCVLCECMCRVCVCVRWCGYVVVCGIGGPVDVKLN